MWCKAKGILYIVVASLDKMLHDNYLCSVESNKQQIKGVRSKIQAENSETKLHLSESGFVLRIAPLLFSRDRKIKMKKSIHEKSNLHDYMPDKQTHLQIVINPTEKKKKMVTIFLLVANISFQLITYGFCYGTQ